MKVVYLSLISALAIMGFSQTAWSDSSKLSNGASPAAEAGQKSTVKWYYEGCAAYPIVVETTDKDQLSTPIAAAADEPQRQSSLGSSRLPSIE